MLVLPTYFGVLYNYVQIRYLLNVKNEYFEQQLVIVLYKFIYAVECIMNRMRSIFLKREYVYCVYFL